MEGSPKFKPQLSQRSSSRRRRASNASNSPEFEFWMVRNPSCPPPNLLSADELFVDGVLLPLHLLPNHSDPPDPNPNFSDPPDPNPQPISEPPVPNPEPTSEPRATDPEPGPGPELSTGPALTASKRWRDIFKKGEKKTVVKTDENDKEKDKKKERKGGGGGGSSSAELNINIWPFSRSRSAGNAYTRPKPLFGSPATRKVNSAPCSRSNSTGESKSRKWPPASPGRAGVHLGRSSPVWQVRRGGSVLGKSSSSEQQARNAEKGNKKEIPENRRSKNAPVIAASGGSSVGGAKARVLNLNVPTCIGYRSHLSCRSQENSAIGVGSSNRGGGGGANGGVKGGGGNGIGGNGGAGGNLFNLRNLFSKKVY